MVSVLESLLLAYPSAAWDWSAVSCNPAVSFQFILDHPTLPWVIRHVARNPSVLEDHVRKHAYYPWDFENLCANPNMSIDFFREFIIKPDEMLRVDWHLLSANPGITMIDVTNNPLYNWDDRYLSANPNLTSNFILNEGRTRKWYVPLVCANPGITDRDIFKSTMKELFEWDYRNLSANPNLPIKFVDDHRSYDWNYHTISSNASLTDIQTYHQIKWDAHGLSLNANITFEYVHAHPEVKWHIPSLLSNNGIPLSVIEDNARWFNIENMKTYMSSNATITEQWVISNQGSVDWKRLSRNTFLA